MADMEELRKRAWQEKIDKVQNDTADAEAGKVAAANDMHIWQDAIERAMARGKRYLYLNFDPTYDYPQDRERQIEVAPRMQNFSLFSTRSTAFKRAYAEALEILLGPPFTAKFSAIEYPDEPRMFVRKFTIKW